MTILLHTVHHPGLPQSRDVVTAVSSVEWEFLYLERQFSYWNGCDALLMFVISLLLQDYFTLRQSKPCQWSNQDEWANRFHENWLPNHLYRKHAIIRIHGVTYPDMHNGTCVTHESLCMPGSLTSDTLWSRWRGKRSPYAQPAIQRIW